MNTIRLAASATCFHLLLVTFVSAQGMNRDDAIVRDMQISANGHATAIITAQPLKSQDVSQSVMRLPQSQPVVQQVEIPRHLLPEVYVAEPMVELNQPEIEVYEEYVPDRFIFSSAYQRKSGGAQSHIGSALYGSDWCDEWRTFCNCEDCCKDMGLFPWDHGKARAHCHSGSRLHSSRTSGCKNCGHGIHGIKR